MIIAVYNLGMVLSSTRLTAFGTALRHLRQALGVSQSELGRRIGRSQGFISDVENGRAAAISLVVADQMCRALGGTLVLGVESPLLVGGPRQRDAAHARCVGHVARRLASAGWEVEVEVEVGTARRPGWIDVLAFHRESGMLLVIEVKTELHDVGEIDRQVGWYLREAPRAGQRFGWRARLVVGALLVLATDDNDRRVSENWALLARSFPGRADALADVLAGSVPQSSARMLALIDPRSRARAWCRRTTRDGRRSPAPYRSVADFLRSCIPVRRSARYSR